MLRLTSNFSSYQLGYTPNPSFLGQVFENFVAVELNKQLAFSKTPAQLYHYRTIAGQEIDFLLEGPNSKIVAIEVKSTTKVSKQDFFHIETFQTDIKSQFHKGFIIYQGKDIIPFGKDLFAIPINSLWTV